MTTCGVRRNRFCNGKDFCPNIFCNQAESRSKYEGPQRIDLAGKFLRGEDGDAIYNFGKQKGQKVKDDPGLAYWMLTKDFSANTLIEAQKILDKLNEDQGDSSFFPADM